MAKRTRKSSRRSYKKARRSSARTSWSKLPARNRGRRSSGSARQTVRIILEQPQPAAPAHVPNSIPVPQGFGLAQGKRSRF